MSGVGAERGVARNRSWKGGIASDYHGHGNVIRRPQRERDGKYDRELCLLKIRNSRLLYGNLK
jgi:hypothetical protein